jgi:hypothetical protein
VVIILRKCQVSLGSRIGRVLVLVIIADPVVVVGLLVVRSRGCCCCRWRRCCRRGVGRGVDVLVLVLGHEPECADGKLAAIL